MCAKKRVNGEGYIQKLPSGSWRGQLMDGYTPAGKKNIVSFTAPTKKEVVRQLHAYRAQAESQIHIDRSLTVREWSELWYAGYADQVQASTYSGYQYTLRIIQARLGSRKLAEVLPLDVEAFLRKLRLEYSESQCSKCRSMLIQIYDEADANGLVSRNPARKSKKPRKIQQPIAVSAAATALPCLDAAPEKDAFHESELAALEAGLEQDMLGHSIQLMLGTGLRVQELLALTKADISEDGSQINVDKAVKTVNGRSLLGPPKSARGKRVIPVPPDYHTSAIYLRDHGREPFLWTLSQQNPLCGVKTFRVKYYRAIDQISGVRRLPPHCCRHTYITRLEAQGVPMEQIARLVGHSKISTTDGYLHTSIDTLAESVSVLSRSPAAPQKGT